MTFEEWLSEYLLNGDLIEEDERGTSGGWPWTGSRSFSPMSFGGKARELLISNNLWGVAATGGADDQRR